MGNYISMPVQSYQPMGDILRDIKEMDLYQIYQGPQDIETTWYYDTEYNCLIEEESCQIVYNIFDFIEPWEYDFFRQDADYSIFTNKKTGGLIEIHYVDGWSPIDTFRLSNYIYGQKCLNS
jgi:hypothetical protein